MLDMTSDRAARAPTAAGPPAAAEGVVASSLVDCLDRVMVCIDMRWPAGYAPGRALGALRERLVSTRFHLAVLGQFKRGKSTFVNALLRARVSPVAAVPLTAIPTFIAWASTCRLHVGYLDGRPDEEFECDGPDGLHDRLSEFITETGNPDNYRRVARVDVYLPADILRGGTVLIDTPGIGSTLKHNTDSALQVLPECDAAIFVMSADPPLTEAEVEYLRRIRDQVVRLFFVLNKVDYLDAAERSQVESFVRQALAKAIGAAEPVQLYPLSARHALDGALAGDARALEMSGLAAIERHIIQYLAREKMTSLEQSVRGKSAVVVGQVIGDAQLQLRALEMPLEDLEQRSEAFQQALRGIRAEQRTARDLLVGDHKRALEALEIEAEDLRRACREHLSTVAEQTIQERNGPVDDEVRQAVAKAVPDFFDRHLHKMTAHVRQDIERILYEHQSKADDLVESVRRTAANLFEIPFQAAEPPEPFKLGPTPYWLTRPSNETLIPSPATLMHRLLPPAARQARLRQQLEDQIAALAQRNVENLRWSIRRGLDETFRRFTAQQDEHLTDAIAVTEGAIRSTLEQRRARADAAADELARWRDAVDRLQRFRGELIGQAS
jgi:hypothetical protein